MAITKTIALSPGMVWGLLVSKAYNPLGWVASSADATTVSLSRDTFTRRFSVRGKNIAESIAIDHHKRSVVFTDTNRGDCVIIVSVQGHDADACCTVTYKVLIEKDGERSELDTIAESACSAFITALERLY